MKFLLLVAALAHAARGGNVALRASDLLAPAGVTYVDGSYHAGLAAGPVAYSRPAFRSAPVAYAAPAAKFAAVPTVEHVPGVADVPVTRIDARPTVIQKTLDIARPAVKTQRYEVRRPAIQKQFYDIEERVVVRPAGSAVVELDEPLSKTQKGPSVIRPTGDGVAVSSSAVAVPAGVAVETAAVGAASPAPAELPTIDINLARSAIPAPVGIAGTAVGPAPIARTSFVAPPAPVGLARSGYVAAPAPAPSVEVRASIPTASPAPIALARSGYAAAAGPAPAPVPSVQFRNFPAPVSYPAPAPVPSVSYSSPFAAHSVGISVPVKTVSVSAPIYAAAVGVSSGAHGISAGHSDVSFSTPAPEYDQQIAQTTPTPDSSDDSVSIDSADFGLARSGGLSRAHQGPQTFAQAPPSHESIFRSEFPPRRFTGGPTPAARGSLVVDYPNPVDLIPQSRFRSGPVYSAGGFQSEINHENQQKLLQLLTARGEVSEVGIGRSGPASYPVEAGQVRARVLSATPAPAYAAPAGERVNTRRVVVNRPIETLQEVEVAEPVTKFERVRVDQPAVVKTASQDVVRVPTSVPVFGKALAPVAPVAPVAAFSADWH